MTEPPTKLLAAYRRRDPEAAAELAARALRIALRTATAMLGDRDQAADVAQDTAIDVLRGANRVKDAEALDAWIHTIAVRQTMHHIRRRRTRTQREIRLDELPEADEATGAESLGDVAVRRQLTATLLEAMETLPAKQRMAVVLRYVHDLPHQQIADAMGIGVGTAGSLISRGVAALRGIPGIEAFADGDAEDGL
jgi:RNA polymerase sigma factor (sigma-70 family)